MDSQRSEALRLQRPGGSKLREAASRSFFHLEGGRQTQAVLLPV